MIYVDNTNEYSQRIYIPKDEADATSGVTGHTITLQEKDYVITENGTTRIHADAGYDGISGGTIGVYVSAATGVTFQHLDVTEDGLYVPSGDGVYTGVTVQVYDRAYQDGYQDGYSSGYTDGRAAGFEEGYVSGRTDGYNEGHSSGFDEGYYSGQTEGYQEGREDGYSEGYTSGSTDGYQEGYRVGYAAGYTEGRAEGYQAGLADGAENQKALLTDGAFTQNGHYTLENGWSAVTISVPDGPYQEGYQDGVDHQKSLLDSLTVTANGITVTSETGYSAVTTNLPMATILPRIDSNGVYSFIPTDFNLQGFDGFEVTVDVPTSGGSSVLTAVTATTNGVYTPPTGFDGFSSVRVDVQLDTATTYNQGFSSGYTSGMTDGYSSGYTEGVAWRDAQDIRGVFTENKTYRRSNTYGWNEVVVRVPTAETYTSGYTDGSEYQKSLLGSTAFTANGSYTNANGWSAVTVNLDTAATYNAGYTSGRTRGYSEGVAAQKGLLTSTTITQNGTYNRANGWSAVTVNIPLTSATITSNGTYTKSNGGYSSVTVNVPTTQVVTLTQAQYNALSPKDNNTIYLIKD